jgi:hypothetical protein
LLKEENGKGDEKTNEVAFAKECFFESKALASRPLFSDLRLDFGVFVSNSFRMDVVSS